MAASSDAHYVSLFHEALFTVSEGLTEVEVKKMKFLSTKHLTATQKETADALQLFDILESSRIISDTYHKFIIYLLDQINREDLKEKFRQIVQSGPGSTFDLPAVNQQLPSSHITSQGNLKTPVDFTQTSPPPDKQVPKTGIFTGISIKTKPARSLSEELARSRGAYNVDDARTTQGGQSMHMSKSFSGSPSLLDQPISEKDSHDPLHPTDRQPLSYKEMSSFLSESTGGQAAGFGQNNRNKLTGMMRNLSLQDPVKQSRDADTSGGVEDDLQTDSAHSLQERSRLSSPQGQRLSCPQQGQRLFPPQGQRLSSAQQDQKLSSPQQSKARGAWDFLENLETDSPDRHNREERRQDVPVDELTRNIDRLTEQQVVREARAAAGSKRPTLREYQKELAARPLHRFANHIICAPTGSGKTLTAAFITYQYMTWFQQNVRNKHFKALFIVHMRHLTWQQRNNFLLYFTNKQDVRTIREQQTFKDALKIDEKMPAVLMLTAQIFVNALKSKEVDIEDLDMLIFDECHHTDQKHPFNEIMKTYLKKKQRLRQPQHVGLSGGSLPFIIGLSASLGVGHEVTALGHLLTLCGNMDSNNVVRVLENVEELKRHVNSPEEDDIKQVLPRDANDRQFGDLLSSIMIDIEDQLPEINEHPLPAHGCKLYETEVKRRLQEVESQISSSRTDIIVYMYLYKYNRALMLYDDLRVKDGVRHLEQFHSERYIAKHPEQVPVEEHCRRLFNSNLNEMKKMGDEEGEHSNHKLGKLAGLLHEIFTENPESKGIVLATMKVATTALREFLMKSSFLQVLPCGITPQRLVGQGNIDEDCLTEAEQKVVLKSFREDGGCNILVATDIAQEGLDMPACNFVIRYNFVSNEIGTVQSKGRARAEGSKCYLIVERNSQNEKREYENRSKVKRMEQAMVELEAMVEEDRLTQIKEKQEERLKAIKRAEDQEALQRNMQNLEQIAIHCKECSAFICQASELQRKGVAGHVTCISKDFKSKVIEITYSRPQRFRDTETTGLIKCATYDCKKQLGTMQNFLRLNPPLGYALRAESFKIVFAQDGGVKTPKQWKKAGFEIPKEEET